MLVLMAVLMVGGPLAVEVSPAAADEAPATAAIDIDALRSMVDDLVAGSFGDKMTAVRDLADSGDDRAIPVLEAFLNGALYTRATDGRVVIGERRGRGLLLRDALTLEELEVVPTTAVNRVAINNRLRGMVRTALGSLTLMSPNTERRRQAAHAVFRARSADAEPLLQEALAIETEPSVRRRMERALAAIHLVHGTETEQRVAALEVLGRVSDREVRTLVASVLIQDSDGNPVEADDAVRAAAADALASIDGRLALWGFAVNVFQGVSLGSVLLLAAFGLAITFGVMGVINMAHGEMVMLGAYTTFLVQQAFRMWAPDAFDYSLAVALPAAFLVAGAFGIAIERGIIRFLYGRPLETLLATWGLSLILQQLVRTVFGSSNVEVGNPSWMSGAVEIAGGFALTYNRIWIIVFSLMVFAMLLVVMRHTGFGLRMRAVTQNRQMAASMGIRTGRIDALTFGLGSGVAGLAGVALSQIDNVSPNLGQGYIIDSFMVVVFGGVGNLWGTFVGAFTLGIVNKFIEPYAGAVLAKILVLVAIILFIQKRPRGLFALRGRAVEN
ncbi:MAG: urea ABC transporter permease subunit UrtB [Rhodospirillales bacterium]|nr:MAG: urea ABC transporter permease subunit UrtB [Rhodospirillales bacterium]TVR97387.1 MAG: urea ABC transporter permease subunit UrtB [Rhodospirillales bacterium]